jgi:hypothetical protein
VFSPNLALVPTVIESPQKWVVCHLKIDRWILDEARMHKHIYEAYKIMIKVLIKLLQHRFNDYKMKKLKMLQKIEHFSESIYLDDIMAFTSP